MLAGLGTALFTGVLFGVLPARRAAQLDPVQALAQTVTDDRQPTPLRSPGADHARSACAASSRWLGIAVGIAAVILLTSIGEGIHRFVLGEFSQFGTNVVGISPGQARRRAAARPPAAHLGAAADAGRCARRCSICRSVTGVVAHGLGQYRGAGASGRLRRTTVYGVSADCAAGVQHAGRRWASSCPPKARKNARAFVVLGAKLKHELFGAANPLGARLRMAGSSFRVIGVLTPRASSWAGPGRHRLHAGGARDGAVQPRRPDEDPPDLCRRLPAKAVAAAAESVLKARHGRDDFTVTTQEDMLSTLSNILDILTMAVGALGSISLLVGGVGIVTIMTIAVAERTHEIGLLLALGAGARTILRLFLGEAVVLAALGGLLGVALGFGLAQLIHLSVPALPVSHALLCAAGRGQHRRSSACWPACCRRAARRGWTRWRRCARSRATLVKSPSSLAAAARGAMRCAQTSP